MGGTIAQALGGRPASKIWTSLALGFAVSRLGFMISGLSFVIAGLGFEVSGLGFEDLCVERLIDAGLRGFGPAGCQATRIWEGRLGGRQASNIRFKKSQNVAGQKSDQVL